MYALDIKNLQLRNYESESAANENGNGFILFETAEELLENPNIKVGSSQVLLDVYNNISPKPVKKFESRLVAAKRITQLAFEMPTLNSRNYIGGKTWDALSPDFARVMKHPLKETHVNSGGKRVPGSAEAATNSTTFGDSVKKNTRTSLKGKMLKTLKDENPRREGTGGFKSMQILIDADGPMAYEDFISAGGRKVDFMWDLERDRVEIV